MPDGRQRLHHARLEEALDLVDADKPDGNVPAALRALDALTAEKPGDFSVCAAQNARATVTAFSRNAKSGGESRGLDGRGHRAWLQLDATAARPRRTPLEQDVIAIRNAVFRPQGDGVFSATRWNGFQWAAATAPNVVANPALRVKDSAGAISTVVATDPVPDRRSVLFLRSRAPRHPRARDGPARRDQAIRLDAGDADAQSARRPIPRRAGVLEEESGYSQDTGADGLESYPIIAEIEFVDAARTRAAVRVTVGYAGATVQMRKQNGCGSQMS